MRSHISKLTRVLSGNIHGLMRNSKPRLIETVCEMKQVEINYGAILSQLYLINCNRFIQGIWFQWLLKLLSKIPLRRNLRSWKDKRINRTMIILLITSELIEHPAKRKMRTSNSMKLHIISSWIGRLTPN
jgi:hypothetical protein